MQGQGTKRQSQRDGEKGRELFALASAGSAFQALGAAERDTKGGNRKGIPLTIRTSLRLSLGFTGFGFLWARFLVLRGALGVLPA